MALKKSIFAACLAVTGLSIPFHVAAQSCEIPEMKLKGDQAAILGDEFIDFIKGVSSPYAHEVFGEAMIEHFMRKLEDADGSDVYVFTTGKDIATYAKEYVNYLKIAKLVNIVQAQDFEAMRTMVIEETTEKGLELFLAELGFTSDDTILRQNVLGLAISAAKITKESFDELKQQECALQNDVAYVGFTKDPRLHWGSKNTLKPTAVDDFMKGYVYGRGTADGGGKRQDYRFALQCFIDTELPEAERVTITKVTPGAGTGIWNIFAEVGAVLSASADYNDARERLGLPITVMLRDYNFRQDFEEQSKELLRLSKTKEYKDFLAATEAMKTVAPIQDWLCDKLKSDKVKGDWLPTVFVNEPAGMMDGPLEFPRHLAIPIAEDGTIRHRAEDNGAIIDYFGEAKDGKLIMDMKVQAHSEDLGNWIEIVRVDITGDFFQGNLDGAFSGSISTCLFGDPPCGQIPISGSFNAQRLQ